MASDDPAFLPVGTEVSAKYRGAFCEAKVKVIRRSVKIKVNIGKGNSLVCDDSSIKEGSLKVGCKVVARQQDGSLVSGTITKVTDCSSYTVVFDDGDEKTVKRSNLVLKGTRHYNESETLDNLPLTNPESFASPARSRRSRKRAKLSPSSDTTSSPSTSPAKRRRKKNLPIGKVVFMESERRKLSWLPAVVVPPKFVIGEMESDSNATYIRSFKDGRFYAVEARELHEFSPKVEPLKSILSGDMQATHKAAIEKAMAYTETGELPWNMELDEIRKPEHAAVESSSEEEEQVEVEKTTPVRKAVQKRPRAEHLDDDSKSDSSVEEDEELLREKDRFVNELKRFHRSQGTPIIRPPVIGQRYIDLYTLNQYVEELGGQQNVTQLLKWRSIYMRLGLPPNQTNCSSAIKHAYKRFIEPYVEHLKKKTFENDPSPPCEEEEEEEEEDFTNNEEKQERGDETEKEEKEEKEEERPLQEEEEEEEPLDTLPPGPLKKEEIDFLAKPSPACLTDSPSESGSDLASVKESEDTAANQVQSYGDCPRNEGAYSVNDKIQVMYGKGKSRRIYEAKVIEVSRDDDAQTNIYLVHYNGWNNRYNEWIYETRIIGKVIGNSFSDRGRPRYKGRMSQEGNGEKGKKRTPTKVEQSLPPGDLSKKRRGRPSKAVTSDSPSKLKSPISKSELFRSKSSELGSTSFELLEPSQSEAHSSPTSVEEAHFPVLPSEHTRLQYQTDESNISQPHNESSLQSPLEGVHSKFETLQSSLISPSCSNEKKKCHSGHCSPCQEDSATESLSPGTPQPEVPQESSKELDFDLKKEEEAPVDICNKDALMKQESLPSPPPCSKEDPQHCISSPPCSKEDSKHCSSSLEEPTLDNITENDDNVPDPVAMETNGFSKDDFTARDAEASIKSAFIKREFEDDLPLAAATALADLIGPVEPMVVSHEKTSSPGGSSDAPLDGEDTAISDQEGQQVNSDSTKGEDLSPGTSPRKGRGRRSTQNTPERKRVKPASSSEDEKLKKRVATLPIDDSNPWVLDFSSQPDLDPSEKIRLILDKMDEMRKLYSSLKSEVMHIERKKRKAKQKEKETQQAQAKQPPSSLPFVDCH